MEVGQRGGFRGVLEDVGVVITPRLRRFTVTFWFVGKSRHNSNGLAVVMVSCSKQAG